jgi:hypothetical protein
MKTSPHHRIFLRLALASCLLSSLPVLAQDPSPAVNVWTWHNDNWRTGQNAGESNLNLNNVNKASFGQLCSYPVDGQVFAQPLVLWDKGSSRNLVYVVTQNDSIYLFDGTNIPQNKTCTLVASNTNLLNAGEVPVDCHNIGHMDCGTISPTVGILGTPVIDENTNHIYFVTYSQITQNQVTNYYHRLHALFTGLNGTTALQEDTAYNSPATISSGSFTPTFSSFLHIQRPGLLLLPGTGNPTPYIYIGFSMMDGATNYPPGFIFRYYGDDLSRAPAVYTTEPDLVTGAGGGVWMDGAGIAAGVDTSGGQTYLYFTTADGDFYTNTGGSQCVDCGDSFVKLTYSLTKSSFFTPFDQACRFSGTGTNPDLDFGSGGVMLVPDNLLTSWPYLAVSADKRQSIWVMQRPAPGVYGGSSSCTGSNGNLETVAGTGLYHNTPAFWQTNTSSGYLYLASQGGS